MDIANRGFPTAQFFKIVIAPMGCTVPVDATDDRYVQPGYAFAFDGSIIGTPIEVAINSNFDNGLVINGTLQVPSIDLYALELGGSKPGDPLTITMHIDSKATPARYDVAFDAGVEFGQPNGTPSIGAAVRVQGELDTSNADVVSLKVSGSAEASLVKLAVIVDPIQVNVRIAKPGKSQDLNYARARADLVARVLGLAITAGGDLTYVDNQLQQLRIYAGASLNILVAEASGTAEFNYCLGRLSDLGSDGSRCTVFKGTINTKPAYRVGFYGSYRVLVWSKPYTWTAYDQRGTEGSAPPEPDIRPNFVPGILPALVPKTMDNRALKVINDLAWNTSQTYMKAVFPAKVGDVKACAKARLGTRWEPTDSVANPPTLAVNPDPGDTCGLVIDAVIGSGDTQRISVICEATNCKATSGALAGKVLAADGPDGVQVTQGREALLTGLRTPPGVIPGGALFDARSAVYGNYPGLWSSDGREHLMPNGPRYIYFQGVNQKWRSKDGPYQPRAISYRLSEDGQLQGLDKDDEPVYSVGRSLTDEGWDNAEAFLFVQNGYSVYVRDKQDDATERFWGVAYSGRCVPYDDSCDVSP